MHRQRTRLASRLPRGRRFARALERYGVAATYELHERALSNRASRRRFATGAPSLDALQRQVVESLDRDGYAVVPFAELVADAALHDAVLREGDAFVADTERELRARSEGGEAHLRTRAGKEFVVRAYSWEGVRLGAAHAWFRAAVSDRLLGVANAYLRMWSKLSYVDYWYTVPQPAGAERVASQLWHLDFDDRHLLKAFLYLTDVDDGAGPFEYVPGSQPGGRLGRLWPWTPLGSPRVAEEEVARHVPADGVRTFTAPRGTLILCNTSGLHRGGFATERPRALAAATYCSPASLAALSLRNYAVEDAAALPSAAARYAVS